MAPMRPVGQGKRLSVRRGVSGPACHFSLCWLAQPASQPGWPGSEPQGAARLRLHSPCTIHSMHDVMAV